MFAVVYSRRCRFAELWECQEKERQGDGFYCKGACARQTGSNVYYYAASERRNVSDEGTAQCGMGRVCDV